MKCLNDLNKEQREASEYCGGPLLILAGAGSGKTRTLTYRIAYLIKTQGVLPTEILAVTFTNKAAKEMRERVEELIGHSARGMWISTFHSCCARILREHVDEIGYPKNFNIIDASDSVNIVKACMKDLGISDRLYSPREVASRISSLKNTMTDPDEFAASAQQFGSDAKVAKIYPMYQERLKASCVLDFDDLLMLTVRLLMKNKKVLAHYQDLFKHVMVDEYQDTNSTQYKIVKLLAMKSKNLCVVGDDDQSIYGWRGADIRNILEFEKDYPNAKVVKLEQNYRSTQCILDAAWSVVSNNPGRRPKKLWTKLGAGEKAEYVRVPSEEAEAQCIAREVAKGVKGGMEYSDYAVLYRTNTQSRTIEESLRREGVPYIVYGGMKFYDRKEIKDVITYLKVISNPVDSVSLKKIVNTPPRGIGEAAMKKAAEAGQDGSLPLVKCLEKLTADESVTAGPRKRIGEFLTMLDGLREAAKTMPPSKLAAKVLADTKYIEHLRDSLGIEAQSKIDNLKELMQSLQAFEKKNEEVTLEDYLSQIALVADMDTEKNPGGKSVTLMTMHLSKGLEFPVVFIAGLEEGLIPHAQSNCNAEELEEERRLLYVGMTRAKKKLYLLNAMSRRLAGLTQSNRESRFIEEIPKELISCRKVNLGTGRAVASSEGFVPRTAMSGRYAGGSPAPVKEKKDPSSPSSSAFRNGERVYHHLWGYGVIESTDGKGGEQKVTVQFKTVGKKKLLARMANLARV